MNFSRKLYVYAKLIAILFIESPCEQTIFCFLLPRIFCSLIIKQE